MCEAQWKDGAINQGEQMSLQKIAQNLAQPAFVNITYVIHNYHLGKK
jgi:hypothetical protein